MHSTRIVDFLKKLKKLSVRITVVPPLADGCQHGETARWQQRALTTRPIGDVLPPMLFQKLVQTCTAEAIPILYPRNPICKFASAKIAAGKADARRRR
jgi:hypothetical protein